MIKQTIPLWKLPGYVIATVTWLQLTLHLYVPGQVFPVIRFTITHWPLTLKTFSVMSTHVMNICAKC